MFNRQSQRQHWLADHFGHRNFSMSPASADASFRQYFRVIINDRSFILMDAPPEQEDLTAFIQVQKMLIKNHTHVPQIFGQNLELGFLLLSDLGSTLYLDVLNHDNAESLYKQAIDSLLKLQLTPQTTPLPKYSQQLLTDEMCLFDDWFIHEHLGYQLTDKQRRILKETRQWLLGYALEQPQVMVHRDYHSRNLLLTEDNNPGIIDFQDAVHGPFSYDLVSLLKDCYISWPDTMVIDLCNYFLNRYNDINHSTISQRQFMNWFHTMTAQRHLKTIGIFCRLNYRDGKSNYLNDIPRTLNYLKQVAEQYPELYEFNQLLIELQPKIKTD
ncbi:MAG: aminoglycoside phosphotransferase [Proteobacteria bacterium]|nr:MAG: aminoglycoside phosphotransferase [Pseudomonadota bacterium]